MVLNRRALVSPLVVVFVLLHCCNSTDVITSSQFISDAKNESLLSANGNYRLGFFSSQDSLDRYVGIWFNKVSQQTVVWVANRLSPMKNRNGVFRITGDGGNIAVFPGVDEILPLWTRNVSVAGTQSTAKLLSTGNFVLTGRKKGSNQIVWQSFDYPTDTVLPGMKFGLDRRTGLNRVLISWKSDDNPAPGVFTAGVDPSGSPQYLFTKIWYHIGGAARGTD